MRGAAVGAPEPEGPGAAGAGRAKRGALRVVRAARGDRSVGGQRREGGRGAEEVQRVEDGLFRADVSSKSRGMDDYLGRTAGLQRAASVQRPRAGRRGGRDAAELAAPGVPLGGRAQNGRRRRAAPPGHPSWPAHPAAAGQQGAPPVPGRPGNALLAPRPRRARGAAPCQSPRRPIGRRPRRSGTRHHPPRPPRDRPRHHLPPQLHVAPLLPLLLPPRAAP
ncbi:hypothetical protein DFJ74DRAFT_672678 [Hyaloraphidium curvatum]|nr:hypothetical protein DFJ74DRAFT_698098 [Hyaloraphidium curvatum]KAI9021359.1 hypothetical protein DFJ74DRAFT_672678 [Hyaloraphidium curvatum]